MPNRIIGRMMTAASSPAHSDLKAQYSIGENTSMPARFKTSNVIGATRNSPNAANCRALKSGVRGMRRSNLCSGFVGSSGTEANSPLFTLCLCEAIRAHDMMNVNSSAVRVRSKPKPLPPHRGRLSSPRNISHAMLPFRKTFIALPTSVCVVR